MSDAAYGGILGLAMTPEAIAERQARERWEQQLLDRGGLRALATADPEAYAELFPNVVFFRRS
jgi:hypothetical protein